MLAACRRMCSVLADKEGLTAASGKRRRAAGMDRMADPNTPGHQACLTFVPPMDAMTGYVPGEQPQAGKFIKLNTNENPYPPSPSVGQAIKACLNEDWEAIPIRWPTPFVAGRRSVGHPIRIGFSVATAATNS